MTNRVAQRDGGSVLVIGGRHGFPCTVRATLEGEQFLRLITHLETCLCAADSHASACQRSKGLRRSIDLDEIPCFTRHASRIGGLRGCLEVERQRPVTESGEHDDVPHANDRPRGQSDGNVVHRVGTTRSTLHVYSPSSIVRT